MHRDYSFSASTLVNIYDDRIEFVSLGGLVKGLSMDAIYMGVSQSRNPNLAAVFYRMKLIESYGTGIGKIRRAYKELSRKPVFESAAGAFRLTLPNMNAIPDDTPESDVSALVVAYIKENGSISRLETEKITGLKVTAAYKLLKEMCAEHLIKSVGKGRLTKYVMD